MYFKDGRPNSGYGKLETIRSNLTEVNISSSNSSYERLAK